MPVILISRGTMSGATLLVDCLRERTGYRCITREDLVGLVNQHGEIANRMVETIGRAARAYEQFSQLRRPYVILMRLALLEFALHDNLVYSGYSGHLLVPYVRHFIRVRISAPLPLRVRMTMDRLKCGEEEAKEYILQEDQRRGQWARFMYGKEIRDPHLYDLWVNLERMSLQAVCSLIQEMARESEFQATPESQAEVEKLHLETLVEAALAMDPRTQALEVGAQAEGGRIELLGPYLEDDQLKVVESIVLGVDGVQGMIYTPGYAPTLSMTP
jgi:cytidylate kinase